MTDYAKWTSQRAYPWPGMHVRECRLTGFSVMVGKDFPIVEPGDTMSLIHPRALFSVTAPGMTMRDLAIEILSENGQVDAENFDLVQAELTCKYGKPTPMFIELLEAADKEKTLEALEKKYGIVYQAGFYGYVFLTGKYYIAKEGETALPVELRGKGIEPVRDMYVE